MYNKGLTMTYHTIPASESQYITIDSGPTEKQQLYMQIRRGLHVRRLAQDAFQNAWKCGDRQYCEQLRRTISKWTECIRRCELKMNSLPGSRDYTDDDLRRWGIQLLT